VGHCERHAVTCTSYFCFLSAWPIPSSKSIQPPSPELAREAGEDELVSADLLDLIEKQKVGDPARWGKHAESLAKRCAQTEKAFFARRYV